MPFIAIALAISLLLGGSAVAATHTEVGAHAAANVSHVFHDMQANVESRITGTTEADDHASSEAQAHADEHSALDSETNVEASTTHKGSIKLNTDLDTDTDINL